MSRERGLSNTERQRRRPASGGRSGDPHGGPAPLPASTAAGFEVQAVPVTHSSRTMTPRPQETPASPPFHSWVSPDGSLWASFHRVGDDIMLRFPGLADFMIAADGGSSACWPVPDLAEATREHLFLNQVLPLMLSQQGRPVFHGGAVETPAGAVAFLGRSGRGKSTLTAAFARAGNRFLTDDALLLEREGGDWSVLPSHPSIRLWDDSEAALVGEEGTRAAPVSFTSKARLLAHGSLPHRAEPAPLVAAYLLGDGLAEQARIAPLAGAAAFSVWAENGFLLDVEDRASLARRLDEIAALVERVPCFLLDYPRRYTDLDGVRRVILAHASSLGDRT